jgi:beta-glucanase (GH16 family)
VIEGHEFGKRCEVGHASTIATTPGGTAAHEANPSGWHTFAAEWRPGRITYIYDGNEVATMTNGITSDPMYLVLNLCLSPWHAPAVVTPSEMLVVWIRVTA